MIHNTYYHNIVLFLCNIMNLYLQIILYLCTRIRNNEENEMVFDYGAGLHGIWQQCAADIKGGPDASIARLPRDSRQDAYRLCADG